MENRRWLILKSEMAPKTSISDQKKLKIDQCHIRIRWFLTTSLGSSHTCIHKISLNSTRKTDNEELSLRQGG